MIKCHTKYNGNDDKVKINKNFVNLDNTVVKIKMTKKRMIKCHTKYSNSKKIAITNFPFAKLKNPGLNICFLNSAI